MHSDPSKDFKKEANIKDKNSKIHPKFVFIIFSFSLGICKLRIMRKTADRPNESAVVVDWIKNTVDAIQRIQDIDGIKKLQHNLRDQISIANDHSLKRKTVISNEVDYELEYLISQISKLSIEETKTVEKEASIMDTVINAVNISEKKKFMFKNGVNIEISSNLIMNHPTSVFYRNAASSGSEQSKDVISINICTKYIEKILRYV